MTFDEKIQHALSQNSQWTGSPDALWERISPQLPSKTPWWKRKPLWAGTLAAAVILLVLFTQNKLPPTNIEIKQEPPMMRSFMAVDEPLALMEAAAGEVINISVKLRTIMEKDAPSPHIHLFTIGPDGDQETILKTELDNFENFKWLGEEGAQISVSVQAPTQPGLYYLSVEGVVERNGESFVLTGESSFLVRE